VLLVRRGTNSKNTIVLATFLVLFQELEPNPKDLFLLMY